MLLTSLGLLGASALIGSGIALKSRRNRGKSMPDYYSPRLVQVEDIVGVPLRANGTDSNGTDSVYIDNGVIYVPTSMLELPTLEVVAGITSHLNGELSPKQRLGIYRRVTEVVK